MSSFELLSLLLSLTKANPLTSTSASASASALASSLYKTNYHHFKEKQQQQQEYWHDDVGLLFELHGRKLLSDVDFLSVMEGSVLTIWARIVHGHLCDGLLLLSSSRNEDKEEIDTTKDQQQKDFINIAIDMYHQWKLRILVTPLISSSSSLDGSKSKSFSSNRSILLLRGDQYICRIYYSVLRMIQISHQLVSASSSSSPSKMNLEELEKLNHPTK